MCIVYSIYINMYFQLFGTLLVLTLLIGVFVNSYVYKQSIYEWLVYIFSAIIGARIAHILFTYDGLGDTFVRLLYWRNGGLNYWGAILAVVLVILLRKKRDSYQVAKNYSIQVSLLLFFVSWAFVVIPSGYGTETASIFGIKPYDFVIHLSEEYSNLYFHPLFLYSAVFWFCSFLFMNIFFSVANIISLCSLSHS